MKDKKTAKQQEIIKGLEEASKGPAIDNSTRTSEDWVANMPEKFLNNHHGELNFAFVQK